MYRLTKQMRTVKGLATIINRLVYLDSPIVYYDELCSLSNPRFAISRSFEAYMRGLFPKLSALKARELALIFLYVSDSDISTRGTSKSKQCLKQAKVALDITAGFA